jgi:hypothetical protein
MNTFLILRKKTRMKIQYLYSLIVLLSFTACTSEENIIEDVIKNNTTVDSTKISTLKKNNITSPESKEIDLSDFSESGIKSYIIKDLNLQLNEAPELTFYNEDIIGDSEIDIIISARLIAKAENENGKFNHLNDRNFGYMGKYHFVYVVDKTSQKVSRININASAVIPLKIKFEDVQKERKALTIDYSIREASFKFVYGQTPNGFKQIFTWQNYNLKKYNTEKSAVNFLSFEPSKTTKYYDILIYNAEISNYDYDQISKNIYEFSPEIKKMETVKRTFFLDTSTWKYRTYLKM